MNDLTYIPTPMTTFCPSKFTCGSVFSPSRRSRS